LKNIFFIFLIISLCQIALGQGEIDTQEKILFQNERSISVALNSNGFGAGYLFGKRKTYLNKTLYSIEFAYIKHPKETKITPYGYGYNYTSRRYVEGKTNLFVNLRPSIGFQREIFSKEDKGSIAIRYFYGLGPSLGICKPVYYTYVEQGPIYYDGLYTKSHATIAGRASFWKGFNEITIYPGLHAKAGLSFEYSSLNQLINAIDVSATFDAFYKKIPIMYTEYNSQFFLTLTVAYRFGWIVDAKYKTPKITREGRLLTD